MERRPREYRLRIDAFTPETLPMSRLAEYMADLATLLGEQERVHFVRLENGSTALVHTIEWEAIPKVQERVQGVRLRQAPPDALKAFDEIDGRLARDNATGVLIEPTGAKIIQFPGRNRAKPPVFGPFNQPGALDGVLIRVGGESDPVPVHIQEGEVIHICYASRIVARQLAPHLFTSALRVHGAGRWRRGSNGRWIMDRFTISQFEVLKDEPLAEAVARLRAVRSPLTTMEDPLAELQRLRHGSDQVQ